jgi:hypothetical protein
VEAARREFAKAREHDGGGEPELEIRRPDRGVVLVELRAKSIELRGKRYVLSLFRDVTERRRAEQALHEQLDELRRFQNVTVDREIRMQELEAEIKRLKARAPAVAR